MVNPEQGLYWMRIMRIIQALFLTPEDAMNITLGNEFERRIAEKVESGLYNSASEVIREALRMLFEKEQWQQQHLATLREEVSKGFHQLDTGKSINRSVAEIFEQSMELQRGKSKSRMLPRKN